MTAKHRGDRSTWACKARILSAVAAGLTAADIVLLPGAAALAEGQPVSLLQGIDNE